MRCQQQLPSDWLIILVTSTPRAICLIWFVHWLLDGSPGLCWAPWGATAAFWLAYNSGHITATCNLFNLIGSLAACCSQPSLLVGHFINSGSPSESQFTSIYRGGRTFSWVQLSLAYEFRNLWISGVCESIVLEI